jgi:hypothetical protein
MAMTEREWQNLRSKKRHATSQPAISTQLYLVVLGLLICLLSLSPTVYVVLKAVENLAGQNLAPDHPPEPDRLH